MNNISKLISLLGGTGAVAEKLNIQPSAISNWKKLNKIPRTKRRAVLELSSYLDVNIESFLPSKKLNNFKFVRKNSTNELFSPSLSRYFLAMPTLPKFILNSLILFI